MVLNFWDSLVGIVFAVCWHGLTVFMWWCRYSIFLHKSWTPNFESRSVMMERGKCQKCVWNRGHTRAIPQNDVSCHVYEFNRWRHGLADVAQLTVRIFCGRSLPMCCENELMCRYVLRKVDLSHSFVSTAPKAVGFSSSYERFRSPLHPPSRKRLSARGTVASTSTGCMLSITTQSRCPVREWIRINIHVLRDCWMLYRGIKILDGWIHMVMSAKRLAENAQSVPAVHRTAVRANCICYAHPLDY